MEIADRYVLFINDKFVETASGKWESSVNPSTEESLAEVAMAGADSLPFASSLCGSCSAVCPVRIDFHGQLLAWRRKRQPLGPFARAGVRVGVLGRIGTLLGEHEVNIRRMELGPGRRSEGDAASLAFGFLTLQGTPTEDVIDAIGDLDGIDSVSLLSL